MGYIKGIENAFTMSTSTYAIHHHSSKWKISTFFVCSQISRRQKYSLAT